MAGIGFDSEKIDRFFKGNYSDDDASYVNEVVCNNNMEKDLKLLFSKQFDEMLPGDSDDQKNLDHILYRIHYNINSRAEKQNIWSSDKLLRWTLRIAAIALLPLIIFFTVQKLNFTSQDKEAWVEINSPAWTRVQFSLPDGTTGWLNSSSSIRYKSGFIKDRQVTLIGEAFFNVFKDKRSPFVVTAKDIKVKVLGTRFNIASYENEKSVEVVLEEGSLLFTETKKNTSYTMKPNELVKYDKVQTDFSTEVVQPQKYLSWTEGKLVFRNDPLDVIARRLERWYNIDVEVDNKLSDDLRLRATFIDEGLEEVLGLLKRSIPVDYKIVNRQVNSDGTFVRKKVIITALNK
jgi:transmembrane sensor